MKEWHVVVLQDHKTISDKIYFNIADAKVAEKEMREKYKVEIAAKQYSLVREYY